MDRLSTNFDVSNNVNLTTQTVQNSKTDDEQTIFEQDNAESHHQKK